MSIETYGTGKRLMAAARILGEKFPNANLILLPVPTSRDKKYVTGTDILLEDTLSCASEKSLVVGYELPDWYSELASACGARVLDLLCDGEYLYDNAYVTALGALGYILTTDTRTPEDLSFGVIGYGRIGSSLVRILLFLGARVKVYTSRMLTRLELGECGVNSCASAEVCVGEKDFAGVDILINTAPKNMADCFEEGRLPRGMRVLELASGENFKGVSGVEFLPALPEKMYPESSGKTYAEAVMRFLKSKSGI